MPLNLKPGHKSVEAYYKALATFEKLGVKHEGAVRSAFQELLDTCARQFDWKLVPEYPIKRKGKLPLKVDGALLDNFNLTHGLWEAKDEADDLEKEIKAKIALGYPRDNILYQSPTRAVLYQQGERTYEADLTKPDDLVHALQLLFDYAPPAIANWEKAVDEFRDRVPQIGKSLSELIAEQRQTNKKFVAAFTDFLNLCRASLNPNLSEPAVEEMIIQHMLTERIFRKIFDVADFTQRNVIAVEIEKVITALTSRSFSRDEFVKKLDHFYVAIENAAATIHDFSEKQTFLNTVYERFFQGFCVKVADTHGIVYTPQPLVNFMVASVEHVLKTEFGKSLAHKDVHILDPFTGTGNFIVNIMRNIPKSALKQKFTEELHCNEVMLLPYYVASMNIEHAYYEATGEYRPFEGICLVDTFQTAESNQGELFSFNEENSERVKRQKKAPIRVIIANPPYNAGQANENDNNKNRKYPELDRRVSLTYGATSEATLLRKLADPYVKAIRFASDRIGQSGIVCFVNNNSFVTDLTFDGMRKELNKDFDEVYVLDLGGNVRKNPKLSGTTHNVFGIQVGVSINFFVKRSHRGKESEPIKIFYSSVDEYWRKEQKYDLLDSANDLSAIDWHKLSPDTKGNWITHETDNEYALYIPTGGKGAGSSLSRATIFNEYSLGASTNRDAVAYDFEARKLKDRIGHFTESYNSEVLRWQKKGCPTDLDSFVRTDEIKWSETLKKRLSEGTSITFSPKKIRSSLYRPFTKKSLYYSHSIIDRPGMFDEVFPQTPSKKGNFVIYSSNHSQIPFTCLMSNEICDAGVAGRAGQCLPLQTYADGGKERQDNITHRALTLFRIFYDDEAISCEDIFHYVYAILYHPQYRSRYAENLKRELPRIPFIGAAAGEKAARFFPLAAVEKMQGNAKPEHNPKASAKLFHEFAAAGQKLADLHVNYESAKEHPLKRVENPDEKLDWRVEKMKLTSEKSALVYNDFLTLEGIPPQVFDYRLGNRSALDWIIDQYRVERDENNKITSDPNRADDEEYIVRLIGQVVTVSVETLKLVRSFPEIVFP